MRIRFVGELPFGVTAKDMVLGAIGRIGVAGGVGHAIEYAGPAIEALSMEGRMTDLQHVDRGRRAGRDGRARRHDVRLPRGPAGARRAAPPGSARSTSGARCAPTRTPTFDRDGRDRRRRRSTPQVTWGTNPGMVAPIDGRVPDPAAYDDPAEREAVERALRYMELEPGTPIEEIGDRPRLHRLVHELADRGPARRGRGRRRPTASRRRCARWSCPGSAKVKRAGGGGGPRPRLHERRLRVARRRAARCASA